MKRQQLFWRKIIYLALIAALFIPISRLSAPATTSDKGGYLSQMRTEMDLSQAELGKIDPASASMSLATLGMRGVAANLLWGRAEHYKKTENFDALMTTLGQIAKLQPNYVSVWQHQAWNISYNASVEFDDYRHRYAWVKKGIDYLKEGITYNRNEPLLLWDAGWFFGHKLGKADEKDQFRRLFRADEDFHKQLPINLEDVRGPDSRPDNWKVAHEWFKLAERVVDDGASITRLAMHYMLGDKKVLQKKQTALRGKNPLVFFSDPAKALINYADAIQTDGYLDEVSLVAWRIAAQAWEKYGQRPILSSYGTHIRLNELDARQQRAKELEQELTALLPGVFEQLLAERQESLSEEEAKVFHMPPGDVPPEDSDLLDQARQKMNVTVIDVANRAPSDLREQARKLANAIMENQQQVDVIRRYQEVVNFEGWRARCAMEQEPNTLAARKLLYDAEHAYEDDSDLVGARKLFDEGWQRWAEVFQRYPRFVDDVEGEVVAESVVKYRDLLGKMNEVFPPPGFPLLDLIKSHSIEYPELAIPETVPNQPDSAADASPPGESQVEAPSSSDEPADGPTQDSSATTLEESDEPGET